jgi:hypothetical protein
VQRLGEADKRIAGGIPRMILVLEGGHALLERYPPVVLSTRKPYCLEAFEGDVEGNR